ncbi:MAG: hypothetical protein K1562_17420 [Candidatus Thiodiazotropha sp. (ex. Lucinisca nassula)]|nr:hypothetical protein [Candidatus Thiodiazotropha sp. (ex. Lucinisca nassula)]MBW9260915.1 hypothetical protein [Candidatus Thiodiazotropha sp. (ex. Lucinisca nassula)]
MVERLTVADEILRPNPWRSELKAQLLPAIVGVEIGIKELRYEYKLSQNRVATDHRSIDCRGFRTTPQGDKKATAVTAELHSIQPEKNLLAVRL